MQQTTLETAADSLIAEIQRSGAREGNRLQLVGLFRKANSHAQLIAALETAEYDLANGGYDKRNTLTTIRAALAAAKEAQ